MYVSPFKLLVFVVECQFCLGKKLVLYTGSNCKTEVSLSDHFYVLPADKNQVMSTCIMVFIILGRMNNTGDITPIHVQ